MVWKEVIGKLFVTRWVYLHNFLVVIGEVENDDIWYTHDTPIFCAVNVLTRIPDQVQKNFAEMNLRLLILQDIETVISEISS